MRSSPPLLGSDVYVVAALLHEYLAESMVTDRIDVRTGKQACHPSSCSCSGPPAPDYYPAALRSEIDALSNEIAKRINMGVYLAGFAQSQVGASSALAMIILRAQRVHK